MPALLRVGASRGESGLAGGAEGPWAFWDGHYFPLPPPRTAGRGANDLMIAFYIVATIYFGFKMLHLFRRFFGTPAAADPAVVAKVQALIGSNAVFVASKSFCPYCTTTKKTLEGLGAQAKVLELDQVEDGGVIQSALKELTGQSTVPNVFIGGKHIGGNSDLQALLKNGQLKQLLAESQ